MCSRQFYISGAYSSPDPDEIQKNIVVALVAAVQVAMKTDWKPIVPHVSGDHRVSWIEAMDRCRGIVNALDPIRDAVVMLPNWKNSIGAIEERQWAVDLGIQVLYFDDLFPGAPAEVHPA